MSSFAEGLPEHLLIVRMQPTRQQRREHPPVVDVVPEVAARVQVRQRRLITVEPTLDPAADDERRGRGAVVGAEGVVRTHAPAELGERRQRHPRLELRGEIDEEGIERPVEFAQQRGVVIRLIVVIVEASEPDMQAHGHRDRD